MTKIEKVVSQLCGLRGEWDGITVQVSRAVVSRARDFIEDFMSLNPSWPAPKVTATGNGGIQFTFLFKLPPGERGLTSQTFQVRHGEREIASVGTYFPWKRDAWAIRWIG